MTGPRGFIEPMIKLKQACDLHSCIPTQVILLALLQNTDFPNHLLEIRKLDLSRYEEMMNALQINLPSGCHVNPVEGGMFVWVTLPSCDTFSLAKTLLERQIAVVPGDVFYPEGTADDSAIRLNFTNASPEQLNYAVDVIASTLREYCA